MPLRTRKILVPLDGSELSRRALPLAELLAGSLGASLTLVTVVETLDDIITATSAGGPIGSAVAYDPRKVYDDAKAAATDQIEGARGGIRMAANTLVLESG